MIKTETKDSFLLHQVSSYDVPTLDLTSPKWALKDDTASMVLGLDVISPGRYQRARPRKPLGVSLDTTLVEAQDFNIEDLIPTRYTGIVAPEYDPTLYSTPFYIHFNADDTVQYSSNVGTLTPTSLDFLVDRTGVSLDAHDRDDLSVLIKSPSSLKGVHPITSSSPATSITIARHLVADFSFVDDVEGLIAEGEGLYVWTNKNSNPTEWWIVKSPKLYAIEGPFPDEVAGAVVVVNSDSRNGTYKSGAAASVETFAQSNDALKMTTDLGLMTNGNHKIRVTFYKTRSLRGALVTDGRKFWLLQDNVYTLKLDLGDDDYLGTEWRMARIARNRLLLVSPTKAPRVLKLDRSTSTAGDETLAGMPPPQKPSSIETMTEDLQVNASWLAVQESTGITGTYQIRVRAVNYEDDVYSDFIPVTLAADNDISSDSAGTTLQLAFSNQKATIICQSNNDDSGTTNGFTPPISPRATHIEVWRTLTGGNVYYREALMDIAAIRVGNERSPDPDYRQWFNSEPTGAIYPIRLSDANLTRLTIQTSNDIAHVGLPPFCKDVVSLGDVTLCFGKGSNDRVQPTLYAYNWFTVSAIYDPSDGDVTFLSDQQTEELHNYVWKDGDELLVTYGGMDATGAKGHLPEGVYAITQKTDANELRIAAGLTANAIGLAGSYALIHCCIRRPYTIEYPTIESDEDVWYSRTDTFAPENFGTDVKILSRNGDIFRRAITVGDQTIVVMDQGVHLLYLSSGVLVKETVVINGWGTPWKNSVVTYGDKVYWATNDSIVELSLSVNPGVDGRRSHLQRIGKLQYENWFREALENGEEVDAGVDLRNGTLRFRRDRGDNYFQSLEMSFQTGKISLQDDDTGFRYFNSYVVEATEQERPLLYSIDTKGRVFKEYHQVAEDIYSGKVLQATLDSPWIIGATYIRHPSKVVFSELMVGEPIRFTLADGSEVIRTINTAVSKEITFDSVPGISKETIFRIAPTRFRIRFAPVYGQDKNSDKVLHTMEAKLHPGEFSGTSASEVTLRAYGDLTNEDSSGKVLVYNDREQTSDNRSVNLTAFGQSIEIELESLDTRNDFQIECLDYEVKEEQSSSMG